MLRRYHPLQWAVIGVVVALVFVRPFYFRDHVDLSPVQGREWRGKSPCEMENELLKAELERMRYMVLHRQVVGRESQEP